MVAVLKKQPQSISKKIPPLAAGDRLTSDEFIRRYNAMPNINKAELIEGVVYMPSPVRNEYHGEQHADIMTWLGNYRAMTPGTRHSDNATIYLDIDNNPQPDAILRIEDKAGGNSINTSDGYLDGAPELLVEIAASTESYDLHDKMNAYRRNGIQEYIVWRVMDSEIDWFYLVNGRYERLVANLEGIMESRIFPGLRLNITAMLEADLATVLADLQQGLQSPEHAKFVQILEERMNSQH